jgi:hypothetical protein
VAKRNVPSFGWIYVVALVLAVVTVGVGVLLALRGVTWAVLAAGAAGVVFVMVTWPLVRVMEAWASASRERMEGFVAPFNERMQEFSMLLNQISEQQLLSDRGKSVAFREKDREALRRAIHEEMSKKDYESALVLVGDMERVFGYRQEAERFRQEIELKRNEVVRRHIAEAVGMVERCCRDEGWNEALNEAHRIASMYPNDEQARELPSQVEGRRQAHKRQLIESYQDAKRRNDIDGGVEILKRLDLYLTPAEAASMQEDARAMFRNKLHNLGEMFTAAYREGRNAEAIRIGEQIVQEFPNSRMAEEVTGQFMPVLRQRANEPASAGT